jgi:hypothetical protein
LPGHARKLAKFADGTPDAWVTVVRTNLIDDPAWGVLVLALGTSCANPGLAWAPRYPGLGGTPPAPAATAP